MGECHDLRLTLGLLMLPLFIDRKLSVALPSVLETIVVLFVFAANVMGELGAFYEKIPIWDSLLHTVNGFICAGVGFGLTDILNRSERVKLSLSPMFVCLFSFCFSYFHLYLPILFLIICIPDHTLSPQIRLPWVVRTALEKLSQT